MSTGYSKLDRRRPVELGHMEDTLDDCDPRACRRHERTLNPRILVVPFVESIRLRSALPRRRWLAASLSDVLPTDLGARGQWHRSSDRRLSPRYATMEDGRSSTSAYA
jgi:hypothetical protein